MKIDCTCKELQWGFDGFSLDEATLICDNGEIVINGVLAKQFQPGKKYQIEVTEV